MQLTAKQILDAYLALRQIILDKRPFPISGAYRLARLHAVLEPEATLIETKRAEIIKQLAGPEPNAPNGQWQVPEEKMAEYRAQWELLAKEPVELACPIVFLGTLGNEPWITAAEFLALGDLIREEKP